MAPADPTTYRTSDGKPPLQLKRGNQLIIDDGSEPLHSLAAGYGSEVVVEPGGQLGHDFHAFGANVSIRGGTVGRYMHVLAGAHVVLEDGYVGAAYEDARIGWDDGLPRENVVVSDGGTLTINGGVVDGPIYAYQGGNVVVSGGSDLWIEHFGGDVSVFGQEMTTRLGQAPEVEYGVPVEIDRSLGIGLSFTLSDDAGSRVSIWRTYSNGSVTFTQLVPGDYNRDQIVDLLDYELFMASMGESVATPGDGADGNFDGEVTMADYQVWRENRGRVFGSDRRVPEPSTALLCVAALLVSTRSRCRQVSR